MPIKSTYFLVLQESDMNKQPRERLPRKDAVPNLLSTYIEFRYGLTFIDMVQLNNSLQESFLFTCILPSKWCSNGFQIGPEYLSERVSHWKVMCYIGPFHRRCAIITTAFDATALKTTTAFNSRQP